MRIGSPYRTAFYGGGMATAEVPGVWPAALNGVPVMLELGGDSALFPEGSWRHETVPLARQQFDASDRPGAATVNPEASWRSPITNWDKGAGQTYYDRPDSNSRRYSTSKGVDPWESYELSLLPGTDDKKSSVNTNLQLLPVRTRLYVVDGGTISYTTDPTVDSPSWTAITGTSGTFTDVATDGAFVYAADGADIFQVAWDGSALGAAWSTENADVLAFVNGRLMSVENTTQVVSYYDSAGTGTAVTVSAVLPGDWEWVGFCDGNSAIYAAGHANQRSTIFRIGIQEDGTGLDAAIPAGELPDGEIVRSIGAYLGFVLIGTDTGVRFATADSSGDLTIGALLETDAKVECFEGQGSYVWFGWPNYDATDTGLGRLSLEEFASVDGLAPAYASDLMAVSQGDVLSVVTFGSARYFAVSGDGFYGQDTALVASGTWDSGKVDFGLVENKIALEVAVAHDGVGSHSVSLSVDGGTADSLGTHTTETTAFPANAIEGRWFNLGLTLTRDSGDTTTGPTVQAVTLTSQPSVPATSMIYAPIVAHEEVHPSGITKRQDTEALIGLIDDLLETRDVATWQEGNVLHQVTVENRELRLWRVAQSGAREGTDLVQLKEV